MSQFLKLALAQVAGSPDPEENLETARQLAAEASAAGADVIVFPEMFMALPPPSSSLAGIAEPLDGPFVTALGHMARHHGIYLAAGMWEHAAGCDRVYNTAVMLSPDGRPLTAYRKLHLFDALNVRESDRMMAGNDLPEIIDVKGLKLGLAICYDLRFPELFRELVFRGADLILIPSAWYAGPVKEEQWATLLRARAIENTVYVAGINLTGSVFSGRTAAFDPFGILKAEAGEGPELLMVRIESGRVRSIRDRLPSLKHYRSDVFAAAD